jgi:hypothetical protein
MRGFALVLVALLATPAAGQEAVTIKLRKEKEGDKVTVTKKRDGTTTVTMGGKKQVKKDEYRYEYTDKVIEFPADAPKPTRVDRAYEVARKTDSLTGELKTLSFSGQTVEIQVSPIAGVGYIFIDRGNAIQPPEVDDFLAEFQGGPKPGQKKPRPDISALLPNKAVKPGEVWTGDLSAIMGIMGNPPFTLEKEKSKVTGKLVKTYAKDDQQWGVIELKIVMALVPGAMGPEVSGTITTDVTMDAVIDGSSRARTVKMKGSGTLAVAKGKGPRVEMTITQEETVTPEK